MEHLKFARMKYVPAFLTNIRLGCKGLPGTNTNLLQNFGNYDRKKIYNVAPRMLKQQQLGWHTGEKTNKVTVLGQNL